MKKTARVIVTYDCPRACQSCCNKHIGDVPQVKFEDLLSYEEVVITGGEPMLLAPRVVEMIHRLRANGFTGKIWLYSSSVKVSRWADKAVLKEVDGVTYTVHFKPSVNDLRDARKLSDFIFENLDNRTHKRSDRLLIDSRCCPEALFSIIGVGFADHWSKVESLQWREDECPLPENEELVFYDLAKE